MIKPRTKGAPTKADKTAKIAAKRAKFAGNKDKFVGDEPKLTDLPDRMEYVMALNWYNYTFDIEKGKIFLLDYMKYAKFQPSQIAAIRRANKKDVSPTICWQARMMMNGVKLTDENMAFFNQKLTYLFEKDVKPTVEKAVVSSGPSIADRIKAKWAATVANLEDEIDLFVMSDFKSEFNPYTYLQSQDIKAAQATKIADHYRPLMEELKLAVTGKDAQIKEAYARHGVARNKKYLEFIQAIVSNAESLANVKKAIRATRKPKEKSAIQLVSKMKFLAESAQYKVASVDPSRIIKSQMLITYNTKYKKLVVYVAASDSTGLSVKGTTIINYDESTSISKTLRKPEDFLPQVLSTSKAGFVRAFAGLKTASSTPNGRINQDTILLRVI
jgi:hypothetical protein